MSFQSLFFSMEGRIGRGGYWIGLIGITVVGFVAGLVLWRIFGAGLILTGGGRFTQFLVVMALLYPGHPHRRAVDVGSRRPRHRRRPKRGIVTRLLRHLPKDDVVAARRRLAAPSRQMRAMLTQFEVDLLTRGLS
jgi:hypothetical protein